MKTKFDWDIMLDEQEIAKALGGSSKRLFEQPRHRDTWRTVLEDARQLLEPAAVWDAFPVREFRHEQVVLENGKRLGNGPVTTVVGGASDIVLAVCTVGQPISDRIDAYQQDKDLLHGVLLDSVASWAVDLLRQQLCQWLDDEAAREGLRTSAPLSPGESAWRVEDQAVIFSLMDASVIGVSLTPSMVMRPLKSLSLLVGRGAQPLGVEGVDNCTFCSMRATCRFRDARPHAVRSS